MSVNGQHVSMRWMFRTKLVIHHLGSTLPRRRDKIPHDVSQRLPEAQGYCSARPLVIRQSIGPILTGKFEFESDKPVNR